jgi:hypothetical protein
VLLPGLVAPQAISHATLLYHYVSTISCLTGGWWITHVLIKARKEQEKKLNTGTACARK